MIALCTDNPQYRLDANQVFISLPSEPREPVEITLTRNQLWQLRHTVMIALDASSNQPEADNAEVVPMRAKEVG